MRRAKQLKRTVVYFLIRGGVSLFNSVPRKAAIFLGAWLGLTLWTILSRERYRTLRHLSLAFGDQLSIREQRRIGRRFFLNSGKNLADILRFRNSFEKEIRPIIKVEGLEYFEAAHSKNRGVLGVTGHIGNFELAAIFIQSLGYDTAVIGRELYDKRIDSLLIQNREAMGLTNMSTTDSPRRMLEWLKAGKVIGVLIDTDSMRVRSVQVPAFGRLSNTPVGQSLLALKTGAALVPAACLRTDDNSYRMVFKPQVTIEPSGDRQQDAIKLTALCTAALEEIVRENPDQWIWLHNRWHTQPDKIA